jgi:hypothetical protein
MTQFTDYLKDKYAFYTTKVCEAMKEIVIRLNSNKSAELIREIDQKQTQSRFESPYQTEQNLDIDDEKDLREFDTQNFETKGDIFEDKIHLNQIKSAFEIFINFINGNRYNILCAQFQSGKTGTSICVLFLFESFNSFLVQESFIKYKIEGAVIFSGLSYIRLREQWDNKLDKYKGIPESFKKIIWGENLKKRDKCNNIKYKNHVFIHDESYRVSTDHMRVDKFYTLQDLRMSYGNDKENYDKRNIFVLSVCATPFAEIKRNDEDNQQKTIVVLEPGFGYIGLDMMRKKGKIKAAYPINIETIDKFKADCTSAFESASGGRPSYCIVRLPNGTTKAHRETNELIKCIAADNIWDVKFIKGKYNDNDNIIAEEELKKEPEKNTFVIIHQKLGLGDNLDKTYISMGFEYTNYKNGELSTAGDNMLQGLPGRCCSYYDPKHIPYIYCDVPTVNNYIEFANSKFMNLLQIPPKSMHLKSEKLKVNRRNNRRYSFIIPIRNYQHPSSEYNYRTFILRNLNKLNQRECRNSMKQEIIEYLENISDGRFFNKNLNKESIVNRLVKQLSNTDEFNDSGKLIDYIVFRNLDSKKEYCKYPLRKLIELNRNPRSQTLEEYASNTIHFDDQEKIQICYSKKEDILFIYSYIFDEENHKQIDDIHQQLVQQGTLSLIGTDAFKGNGMNVCNGVIHKSCEREIDYEKIRTDFDYTFGLFSKELKKLKEHDSYEITHQIGKTIIYFNVEERLIKRYKTDMKKMLKKKFGSSHTVTIEKKRGRRNKKDENSSNILCKSIMVTKSS